MNKDKQKEKNMKEYKEYIHYREKYGKKLSYQEYKKNHKRK